MIIQTVSEKITLVRLAIKILGAIRDGKNSNVINYCNQFIQISPKNSWALWVLAEEYGRQDEIEMAVDYAKRSLEKDPNSFNTLKLIATCRAGQNKEHEAYEYICRAIQNVPKDEKVGKFNFIIMRFLGKLPWFPYNAEDKLRSYELFSNDEKSNWLKWANDYKVWYENHISTTSSL